MWNGHGGYDDAERGPRRGRGGYGGEYDRPMRGGGGRWMEAGPARPRFERGYGRDYWWLGEHELRRRGGFGRYDEAYERFSERTHPRFSPVGGMYPPMGGRHFSTHPPRPIRENTWFSDWTRWF